MYLRRFLIAACGVLLAASPALTQEQSTAKTPTDLLTLAEGAIVVSASANALAALSLTDGAPLTAWHNEGKRDPLPYSFVFEFRAPTMLETVGVAAGGARPGGAPGASANGIRFEASSEGPESGYVEIAAFAAEEDGETRADVDLEKPVRWLRLSVDTNYGNQYWTYLYEAFAFGEQQVDEAIADFSGVYQTRRADFVELKQDGSSLSGCYTQQGGNTLGTLRGNVDNGVARLNWVTDKDISGTALLALDSNGRLDGVQYRQKSRSIWSGEKAPDGTVTQCSEVPPPANPVAEALGETCRVPLYGILFDFDKATLKPASDTVLGNILAALKDDPALSLTVEGHTDSVGGDDYNLDLSQKRAAAVVDWLFANGVDQGRLAPSGMGEAAPVASNDTADGRALNRRVELVKC